MASMVQCLSVVSRQKHAWYGIQTLCARVIVRSHHAFGKLSLPSVHPRGDRLASSFKCVGHAPITTFNSVRGQFSVPMASTGLSRRVSADQLEYLAGFFDGDGYVTVKTNLSSCSMGISQSVANHAILIKFQQAFGGSINVSKNGLGARHQFFEWCIGGDGCRHAAGLLSAVSLAKRQQLKIAADWPRSEEDAASEQRLESAKSLLRELKRTRHSNVTVRSWFYVSGLFDACGCVKVPARSATVRLEAAQNHMPVLASVSVFVEKELPGAKTSVYKMSRADRFAWNCTDGSVSEQILRQMMQADLFSNKAAAELALRMTTQNHASTRQQLAKMAEHEGRYEWVDEAAADRTRAISVLRSKLKRSQSGCPLEQLRLDTMITHHEICSLVFKEAALRQDVRRLLIEVGEAR